jgi:hypothetical protein
MNSDRLGLSLLSFVDERIENKARVCFCHECRPHDRRGSGVRNELRSNSLTEKGKGHLDQLIYHMGLEQLMIISTHPAS